MTSEWKNFKECSEFVDFLKKNYPKVCSLSIWKKTHFSSYNKACAMKLQRLVQKDMGWKVGQRFNNPWHFFTTPLEYKEFIERELNFLKKSIQWKKHHRSSYDRALKLGLHKDIAKLLGWKTYSNDAKKLETMDDFVDFLKKNYPNAESLTDWKNANVGSYRKATRIGIQRDVARSLGWKILGDEMLKKSLNSSESISTDEKEKEACHTKILKQA